LEARALGPFKQTEAAAILERVVDLPSVPAVALEIIQLTENEDSTLDELAEAISRDPALAGKVLQLANSSVYGTGSPVATLQRSMARIGTRAVKLLALSFSLAGSLPASGWGPFDFRQYWRRSIVRAVAARSLAGRLSSSQVDEAFLCGLLSRIGQLVLGHCLPEEYTDVMRAAGDEWPGSEHEQRVFGCDGAELGVALLRSWSLPDVLCDAIGFASKPSQPPDDGNDPSQSLARILRFASGFEALFCRNDHGPAMEQLISRWCDEHQMELDHLESFIVELESDVAETARSLDVEIGKIGIEEILATARLRIVQESLTIASDAQNVKQYAAKLEQENEALSDRAYTDALTQLPNRACFDETLKQHVLNREAGEGEALGVLLIDIDHFKAFNDTYGHVTGDEVLALVARSIRNAMRSGEFAARYGGEEFVAIISGVTEDGLAAAAERVRTAVETAKLDRAGATISVTVSVGGVCDSEIAHPEQIEKLVEAADGELYRAKRKGRNRCCIATAGSGS
jgi:diguanylate cyclase (GGDEF)-like protein